DFVRVTAAAGAPSEASAYWGYRMLEVAPGGSVSLAPHDGARGLLSVPGGNVWLEEPAPAPGKRVVVSWLPRPVEVTLRFVLPEQAGGYRLSAGRWIDVGDGGTLIARVEAAGGGARTTVEAVPATGNRGPQIELDELALAPAGMVRLTAARTVDP